MVYDDGVFVLGAKFTNTPHTISCQQRVLFSGCCCYQATGSSFTERERARKNERERTWCMCWCIPRKTSRWKDSCTRRNILEHAKALDFWWNEVFLFFSVSLRYQKCYCCKNFHQISTYKYLVQMLFFTVSSSPEEINCCCLFLTVHFFARTLSPSIPLLKFREKRFQFATTEKKHNESSSFFEQKGSQLLPEVEQQTFGCDAPRKFGGIFTGRN